MVYYCVMQHLGELVLMFLNRELQPSCQLACLETVRILSRDKHCLDPFINHSALSTLTHCAGITLPSCTTPAHGQKVGGQGICQIFNTFKPYSPVCCTTLITPDIQRKDNKTFTTILFFQCMLEILEKL